MANFHAVTASNGARVRDPEAARKILARFHLCMEDGHLSVEEGRVHLFGYDSPEMVLIPDRLPRGLVRKFKRENRRRPKGWEELWDSGFDLREWQQNQKQATDIDALAEAIAPQLMEDWVIQSVGNEKCIFPLYACQWTIKPSGEVVVRSLER